WVVQVGRLRCLRGIDTLTAVGLCAEIGDFERFAKAEQLMSYIGLVPCEATTGQQRRLGQRPLFHNRYQSDRASRTACRTATHPADHNPPPHQLKARNS
ncbi:MAG: transposase, partial [Solirubrobacteraceae bacterium]